MNRENCALLTEGHANKVSIAQSNAKCASGDLSCSSAYLPLVVPRQQCIFCSTLQKVRYRSLPSRRVVKRVDAILCPLRTLTEPNSPSR